VECTHPALAAHMTEAVADFHDVVKARVVIREPLKEFVDRQATEIFFLGLWFVLQWL
jgi:hypothetical protein